MTQPFEHDIFLSYARADDEPERAGDLGWVTQFEQQLATGVRKVLGREIRIWRDTSRDQSEVFGPAIQRALDSSAVVIALVSPSSLHSTWCQKELAWFAEACQRGSGLEVGGRRRVLPVLLHDVPHEDWPASCRGVSGVKFFEREGDARGLPLDPNDTEFLRRRRRLDGEVARLLTLLQAAHGSGATGAPSRSHAANAANAANAATVAQDDDETPLSIFVAACPDELRPLRTHLGKQLGAAGFQLADDVPPPHGDDHESAARAAIEACDLSVHLLGEQPGERIALDYDDPDDATRLTYPTEQLRIASGGVLPGAEPAGADVSDASERLILLPDDLDVDRTPVGPHRQLVTDLLSAECAGPSLDVFQTSRGQVVQAVVNRAHAIRDRRRQSAPTDGEPVCAFLDMHTHDLRHAEGLIDYLGKHKVVPFVLPATGRSHAMDLFADQLRRARLFVVVFGQVAREWVQYRLIEAFKVALTHNLTTRMHVYVAPPAKPTTTIQFPNTVVIDNSQGFDPSSLAPMLDGLA